MEQRKEAIICLEGLGKQFQTTNGTVTALDDINLEILKGEIFGIIGLSGAGKSTLVRCINYLETPTAGRVIFEGQNLSMMKEAEIRKARQSMGMIFQQFNLLAQRNVLQNVCFPMEIAGVPKAEAKKRAAELLKLVGLEERMKAYPAQLSGGQKQRVGVARAFSANPDIILMDEPFSALDPVTRGELQNEVVKLQKRFHKTIVFVTHDMDEAIKMADRICIIQNGQIAQFDRPEEILKRPANAYVEEFVGKNRLWGNPAYIHAEDIMKKAVIHISKNRTVLQALQIMRHNTVDSLLVTSGREHRLEGIVWLKNLQEVKDYSASLEEYITQDYISVYADTSLQEIIDTVDYDASGIIPVVNHENELLGGLTKSGLLATLSKRYRRDSTEGAEE